MAPGGRNNRSRLDSRYKTTNRAGTWRCPKMSHFQQKICGGSIRKSNSSAPRLTKGPTITQTARGTVGGVRQPWRRGRSVWIPLPGS
jgi:hypothetical protein